MLKMSLLMSILIGPHWHANRLFQSTLDLGWICAVVGLFVSPTLTGWNPNAQCDSVRR